MSNKLSDHELISLYHQGAKEQPSHELDRKILTLAKQKANHNSDVDSTTMPTKDNEQAASEKDTYPVALNKVEVISTHSLQNKAVNEAQQPARESNCIKTNTLKSKAVAKENVNKSTINSGNKKPLYKTWYGQLSTAASLILVTILYLQPMQNIPLILDDRGDSAQAIGFHKIPNESQQVDMIQSESQQASPEVIENEIQNKLMKQSKRLLLKQQRSHLEALPYPQNKHSSETQSALSHLPLQVSETLQKIALHLDKGEQEQAHKLFKDLLKKYPNRVKEISARYQALL